MNSAEDHQGATSREEHNEAVGKVDLSPAATPVQAILIVVAAINDVFTEIKNFLCVGIIGEFASSQAVGVIKTEVNLFKSSSLLNSMQLGLHFGSRVEPGEVECPEYKGDKDEATSMFFYYRLMGLRLGLDQFVSGREGLHFGCHGC